MWEYVLHTDIKLYQLSQDADDKLFLLLGKMQSAVQSDQRAILFVGKGFIDLFANSEALRSDCMDVQADLELQCKHMA